MTRKLASIQRIYKIEPIKGADKIELAYVLGWQCVVNKGQFKKGDLGIYFEIDSFLPMKPEFEFLRKSCYKNTPIMGEGYRLRTQKFKGQISQGLLLPIEACITHSVIFDVGSDVTELLGVKKWEIEERATTGGTIKGELPRSIPHTDETRIQVEPELLNDFAGLEYYISTKLDGSSHSISIDADGFHVTGHNYEYKDGSFYTLITEHKYKEKLEAFVANDKTIKEITLQGELCAPGIQKNRLKLARPDWFVFTVMINGKRVPLQKMQEVCKKLNMPTVPIEEVGKDLPSKYPTIEKLLKRAEGEYPKGGAKEGIVIRPTIPIYSERISAPLSMKVINNKFLLKNEE